MGYGWVGFWIAFGICYSVVEVVSYLRWKTRVEYGLSLETNWFGEYKNDK